MFCMEQRISSAPEEERVVSTVPSAPYRWVRVIWYVASVVNVLCAVRFALKLLGASTASPFVTFEYALSAPLVAPFRGIFPEPASGQFNWESSALVAIAVYSLVAAGIVALVRILAGPRRRRTVVD